MLPEVQMYFTYFNYARHACVSFFCFSLGISWSHEIGKFELCRLALHKIYMYLGKLCGCVIHERAAFRLNERRTPRPPLSSTTSSLPAKTSAFCVARITLPSCEFVYELSCTEWLGHRNESLVFAIHCNKKKTNSSCLWMCFQWFTDCIKFKNCVIMSMSAYYDVYFAFSQTVLEMCIFTEDLSVTMRIYDEIVPYVSNANRSITTRHSVIAII